MPSDTRTIALCAPAAFRSTVAELIAGSCGWDVIDLATDDADQVRAVSERVDGYVLYNDGVSAEVLSALRARPSERPLIAIAGEDCPEVNADCWFPRLNGALLTTTLNQLVPAEGTSSLSEPPSSTSWRRKADMIIGTSTATRELLHTLDR
ncbi:MAG: hypothetical protein QOI41_5601, partial [Myxococcales bacterium]|nr:hypothetical protein [Myxococcales bacterium]